MALPPVETLSRLAHELHAAHTGGGRAANRRLRVWPKFVESSDDPLAAAHVAVAETRSACDDANMRLAIRSGFVQSLPALFVSGLASSASAQDPSWIRQIGTLGADHAYAAAPDEVGGLYVAGNTAGDLGGASAGMEDAWLARYDGAGNQSWLRQFGTTARDFLFAAAPDGAGGVYVAGDTFGAMGGPSVGSRDIWFARYDGAGNQSWIRQLGTTGIDFPYAIAADGAHGAFLVGSTRGSLSGPNAGLEDAWLARYDGAGNQTWIRQLGTTAADIATSVARDDAGGLFVGGITLGALAGLHAGSEDTWLARFDGAGSQLWIRQVGTTARDFVHAAAADGAGGVIIGGRTSGALSGTNAGLDDAWLARYDSVGSRSWILQLGTTGAERVSAIAADGAGGMFIGGDTSGGLAAPNAGLTDAWLGRYDGAGHESWTRQLGTTAADAAYALAFDGSGRVFVAGVTQGGLGGANAGSVDGWCARYEGGPGSTRYCTPAASNSTGQPTSLTATGSHSASTNQLTLSASRLPLNSFGFFLTSRIQGLVTGAGGSQGDLCLGGTIGRYVGAGQVRNSGAAGTFALLLDLTRTPAATAFVSIGAGETWHFQAWFRDVGPGGQASSNFSDALSILFQ